MDILGPLPVSEKGHKYILVISDYFTKWTEAYPMPNMEAATIATLFVHNFVCRFGAPDFVHTDQGRNFESTLMSEICKLLGIVKTRTTPYHPQSDGLVERFNHTLLTMLSIVAKDREQDWDLHLPLVMMAYRTSVQESTGATPFATSVLIVLSGHDRQESAGSERYIPAGQAKGGNIQVLRITLIEALVPRSREKG